MDRWACVDAFAFPLQVLLGLYPQWREEPVAVLDRDHPQGRLLWVNRQGRAGRLRRGMRYGQALALMPTLRAEAVDERVLEKRAEEMAQTLRRYSPRVEQAREHPGLFWLDASGLKKLYPQWEDWVEPLRRDLQKEHQVYVAVVIGFGRFQTFALARSTKKSGLFTSREAEDRASATVRLGELDLSNSSLELTRRLGIHTVGELLAMPPESLRRRVGKELFVLYEMASRTKEKPLENHEELPPPEREEHLDYEETNTTRMLFLIKRHLHGLLETLERAGERLTLLEITLSFRDAVPETHQIKMARPTLEPLIILELVRLRLESLVLKAGILSLGLKARGERIETGQMELFLEAPVRDVEAGNRALARLKAEFGDQAVQQVVLRPSHLPEGRFSLEEMEHLAMPKGQHHEEKGAVKKENQDEQGPAVRRFFPAPIRLARPPGSIATTGPHIVSGGWWVRPVHRAYHLVRTDEERLLWVFFDEARQRWYVHAEF